MGKVKGRLSAEVKSAEITNQAQNKFTFRKLKPTAMSVDEDELLGQGALIAAPEDAETLTREQQIQKSHPMFLSGLLDQVVLQV